MNDNIFKMPYDTLIPMIKSEQEIFDAHQRAPWIRLDKSTYEPVDGSGLTVDEIYQELIDNTYTEQWGDNTWLLVGATDYVYDKDGNKKFVGSGVWKNGVIDTALVNQMMAYGELVQWWDYIERKELFEMTAEQYKEKKREELEALSKPGSFTFDCEVKGQTLTFCVDDSDRIDVIGQLIMGQTEIEIHDINRVNMEPYNQQEAGLVMATLAAVTRAYKYPIDAKIKALGELPDGFTKADVDKVVG